MLPGEVRGDAEFTAFQEKLATVVVNALAVGKRISRRSAVGCCCPLGAHPDSNGNSMPSSGYAHEHGWPEVDVTNLRKFIEGFCGGCDTGSYVDLGRAYREQFP